MFNAEKLLGQLAGDLIGGATKKKGGNSLLSSLSSGGGLMTLIGLGVGAYEIFQDQQQTKAGQAPAAAPPPPPGAGSPPPPPFPGSTPSAPSTPAAPAPPALSTAAAPPPPQAAAVDTQDLALRIIRMMIASAHADGHLDQEEEARILGQAEKSGLSREERLFLLEELHNPKTIAELTTGIVDPSIARAIYLAAANSIEIDTTEERRFLDDLAASLGISKALQSFIENQQ